MTQKPRVSAQQHIEAHTNQRICDDFITSTPDVLVSVSFDLHDHAAAHRALADAVASVRAQIGETTPNLKPHIVSICNDADNHDCGCDCARRDKGAAVRGAPEQATVEAVLDQGEGVVTETLVYRWHDACGQFGWTRESDPESCVSDKDIIRMRPKGNR